MTPGSNPDLASLASDADERRSRHHQRPRIRASRGRRRVDLSPAVTRESWILDQTVLTEPHVTSSLWEGSLVSWDDEAALRECRVPLLYIDAGTPNADLARAVNLARG
jgi:hypothetical protein